MQITNDNARRVILVNWKKLATNNFEVFSSLKNFCDNHPAYNYNTLSNYLSKKRIPYENDEIKLERKPLQVQSGKPELPKRLFWEFDYEKLDWQRSYRTIIERVIEWGSPEEWKNMIHFYGVQSVIKALKEDIPYLTDKGVEAVCAYFQLSKTELKCYTKKQLQKEHWI
jgi:hypothetical protein